jgi:isocitrate lyase
MLSLLELMQRYSILIKSKAADLLTSNIDRRDHPFILGCTNASLEPLVHVMESARAEGKLGTALKAVEDEWMASAGLKLFSDAVADSLGASSPHLAAWKEKSSVMSNQDARVLAKSFGVEIHWDWDAPRTREGYFRYRGGTPCCIVRGRAFAPYCDLLWMETKKPIYEQAKEV